MGQYVYGLILVGVCVAVVELLSFGGEGGKMGGYVRLVAGLCILVACLQPLREGISYLTDLAQGEIPMPNLDHVVVPEDYGQMFDSYLGDTCQTETQTWVAETLTGVFGISQEHYQVTVTMTDEAGIFYPSEVYITLTGIGIFENPHQIEAYITAQLSCPCYVRVGT